MFSAFFGFIVAYSPGRGRPPQTPANEAILSKHPVMKRGGCRDHLRFGGQSRSEPRFHVA